MAEDEKMIQNQIENEEQLIQAEFDALLRDYAATAHKQKVEIITRAFEFARKAHQGVRRKSGEPYIMHPLAVARIVINEIGLGSTSICAALLHDVVEDTEYTVEDIAAAFNPKIASIVEGLTKISGGIFGENTSAQAENFRKLILTMPEDVRVILIKMADRLHNMRTLGSMPRAKQLKITGETKYIYAPLAQRLGFFSIKTELENLCLKYEQPEIYKQLDMQRTQMMPVLENSVECFIQPIAQMLDSKGYKYEIVKRIKMPYSIYKKMHDKHCKFEEVYDLIAIRIILTPQEGQNEKEICWVTYNSITEIFTPHPNRTRDWISSPKSNGYEALHVTVMGPGGNWIEVQIRSERMNDIAERGLAAHWKYKSGEKEESELDKWFKSLKEMLDTSDFTNAVEFMDTFKLNLYSQEIVVFTPSGETRKMPSRSTVLDFAFSIHTELGTHCIGAKVDHELKPLSYQLKSGDQVEILTSKTQQPQMEWLEFCTTGKAKGQLRTILKKEMKKRVADGQNMVEQKLKELGYTLNSNTIQQILNFYNVRHTNEFYFAIGSGKLDVSELANLFKQKSTSTQWRKFWKLNFGGNKKETQQVETTEKNKIDKKKTFKISDIGNGSDYVIADCCHPIPGDNVIGFVDDDGRVVVHKVECHNALKLQSSFGNRVVSAQWETHKVLSFLATIEVQGIDAPGLLKKIVDILNDDYTINIKQLNISAIDGVFAGEIELYVYSVDDVDHLCQKLMTIKALRVVKRAK